MPIRPYVLLSAAVSVDGRLDDASGDRLILSNPLDLDRVDAERAASDALLIGAGTLRKDDPRLLVRSALRRAERIAAGRPEHPLKVVVTGAGELDAGARFWHCGGDKLVFTVDGAEGRARAAVGAHAEVVSTGPALDWGRILDELGLRGVRRLLVEGGGIVHTQLLAQNLADELQLVIAPLLIGRSGAPPFLGPAAYPDGPRARMELLETRPIGDVVLRRYAPKSRCPQAR